MINLNDSHQLRELLEFDSPTAVAAMDHQVLIRGDKIAITVGETGETISYAEFGRRTDSLAASFSELGIRPGDTVATLSDAPLTPLLTMFAAWKVGAVFAPINPDYSGDFLVYHLNDCGARTVVCSPEAFQNLESVRLSVIEHLTIITDEGKPEQGALSLAQLCTGGLRPSHSPQFSDPASIIYTSGTTGPAKGVVQSHRWINQYTWQYRRWINTNDVVHVDLPMYHVGAAFFNVVKALWVGASVSLWKRFSASKYWDRINASGATSALLFDVMVPWLLAQPASPDDQKNSLRNVHMQPLPPNHAEFAARFSVDFITAGFGQTESGSAIYALIDEFPDDNGGTPGELYAGLTKRETRAQAIEDDALIVTSSHSSPQGLMGLPSPFLEIDLHNEDGDSCKPFEVGEIVVRPRVASVIFSRYLGKPDESLQSFRDLWFHTRDSAHRDNNGVFYFGGRLGDRIRVKGENVSASDLEIALTHHPEILRVAAIAVSSEVSEEDEIALFVEPNQDSSLTVDDVFAFAQERLPRSMYPHHIRLVNTMPTTETNKVQKHKLRAMFDDFNLEDRTP